jgi:sugar/nucleoside kinase (ribokinase family)
MKVITLPGVTFMITDSANGAYAFLDGTTWFARPEGIKAISKTGAGDAIGSGVVAGLIREMGIEDALKIGTLNAESVIRKHGAKNGILTKWPTTTSLKKIKVRQLS